MEESNLLAGDRLVFEGAVENVVYYNELNGYVVFEMTAPDEDEGAIVCTGYMPRLSAGETLRVEGRFVVHPTYGRQFSFEAYEKVVPTSEAGIEKYLGSGVIKGVREKLAKKIVERFGKDTFEIIADHPEKLTEIKGITSEKAMTISAIFHEQAQMRRIVMYLQGLGISNAFAIKIYKKHRENTIEAVQANPYALADDIAGIGFKLADSIAQKAGIDRDSPFRIASAVKYTLSQAAADGHVYLPRAVLIPRAAELLELPAEYVENGVAKMQMERVIWQENVEGEQAVYLHSFFYAEAGVAKKITELSRNAPKSVRDVLSEIGELERQNGLALAEEQKLAVSSAMEHGVLVITGGPGTGKTTAINTIIQIFSSDGYDIELAAPTGRAAKRMTETTGMEAKTIHRLLEVQRMDGDGRAHSFARNKDNPIETDVIIIDESSMVDILLMNSLLSAIEAGTRLILVGDVDQLPSVGPGNVLRDIIDSGCLPVVRLTEVFRQARQSAIVMNAHRINRGEYPVLNEKDSDFFFTSRASIDGVVDTILELVAKRLPRYANCDPVIDIQVLTPMRKSPLGVSELNRSLQARLNPPGPRKKEYSTRTDIFREGDKVMQIKNNYDMPWKITDRWGGVVQEGVGVYNGDTGVIECIDDFEERLTVRFDGRRLVDYDYGRVDELELAYAITIHKSQGSEYDVVVMPIHSGPPMLMSRNLLYTGVTRAKKLAVIVGAAAAMYRMVDNVREAQRYSSLASRIIKMNELFSG